MLPALVNQTAGVEKLTRRSNSNLLKFVFNCPTEVKHAVVDERA